MRYLLNRAREASTWCGLVLILTAAGLTLTPEQADGIIAAGMAVAGAIGAFLPDRKNQ